MGFRDMNKKLKRTIKEVTETKPEVEMGDK